MHLRNGSHHETASDSRLLVTVEEAASMLSLGRTLTWALVRKNELQSIKVNNTRRVVVASLYEYIERQLALAS
jgi:excisionase family DNA binding protein